jgi:hypothetical protein
MASREGSCGAEKGQCHHKTKSGQHHAIVASVATNSGQFNNKKNNERAGNRTLTPADECVLQTGPTGPPGPPAATPQLWQLQVAQAAIPTRSPNRRLGPPPLIQKKKKNGLSFISNRQWRKEGTLRASGVGGD